MSDPFIGTNYTGEFTEEEIRQIGGYVLDIMVTGTVEYSIMVGYNVFSIRLSRTQDWRSILLLMFYASDISASEDMRVSPKVTVQRLLVDSREVLFSGTLDELAKSMGHF